MNKVLLAVGILSASVAVGQTTRTTKSSSTSTSTSNYNNSNTNNYNSSNATSSGSSYSGTSGSMSTGTTGAGATGTTGTYNSNGTYNNSTAVTPSGSNNYNTMGTSGATTTDTYSTSSPSGSMSTGATGTTGTYNSNGTYNNSTTVTPSGSGNYNTMGTSGATTTPSTSYDNSMNSGTSTTTTNTYSTTSRTAPDPAGRNGYNNFVFGIYAGLNATSFKGESIDAENPSARLGYQAGFFVRGGGRLFGQIGAEYFASSSNYFRAGNGSSTQAIRDYINIQYIQVPVYIGYKLTDSERGNSAIRVQVGAEYANRISSNSNSFNLSKDEIKSGSFNALGQLGFDFGPFLIDLTYHYGLGDAVQINTFQGSSRRILSASVGFKF
ncbi:outer membrane beta-barrel protein [Fibrella aestuarina]|nr:outer membrane beta-barrel protein [Fibrella aestuarina]